MRFPTRRSTAVAGVSALAASTVVALAGLAPAGATQATSASPTGCQLGNGVKHVISLVFDNVHFSRDNPNVPSDLEQMPHLLNFLKSNGTVFSNTHTPLIAHTADDSLTIYTGLYGDRHGQPVSNSYKTYNPDGTHRPGRLVRVLDRTGLRHRQGARPRATTPRPPWPIRASVPATVDQHRPADPGPVGAVHPGRLLGRRLLHRQHGAGEHRARPAHRLRAELPRGGAVQRRPVLVQGPGDRRLRRRRGALRPGRRRPAPTPGR